MSDKKKKQDEWDKAAEKNKEANLERGLAKVPQFAALRLPDTAAETFEEMDKVKSEAFTAIMKGTVRIKKLTGLILGRYLIHAKKIAEMGQFGPLCEEYGYSERYARKCIKAAEFQANRALTGKSAPGGTFDLDVGKIAAMRNEELDALADDDELFGLGDEEIAKMSKREFQTFLETARAERDTANAELSKKTDQLSKSHAKIRDLEEKNKLLEDGPSNLAEVDTLCQEMKLKSLEIVGKIGTVSSMAEVPEAKRLVKEALDYILDQIRGRYAKFEGTVNLKGN